MSAQEAFDTLKTFFETRRAAAQALGTIREGIEIGIVIGETVDCALFRRGETPVVEKRAAVQPDVVFHIRPESVYVLNGQAKDDIADIGINILKEVLAGNITVKVPGKILNVLGRGYLDVVKAGGAPVLEFLARNGLTNFGKFASRLKKMKH